MASDGSLVSKMELGVAVTFTLLWRSLVALPDTSAAQGDVEVALGKSLDFARC